jgi:hypothetical protein
MPPLSLEERRRQADAELAAKQQADLAYYLSFTRGRQEPAPQPAPAPPAPRATPRYPRRCTAAKRHGRGPLARPVLGEGVRAPGVARLMRARLEQRIAAERAARSTGTDEPTS